jgi:hypothetical protein
MALNIVFVLLLGLSWSFEAHALMPIARPIPTLTCPYDQAKIPDSGLLHVSNDSIVSSPDAVYANLYTNRLDLMPIERIGQPEQPLPSCPNDGFVFYKSQFTDTELNSLRSFVQSDAYLKLRNESTHYRAAKLMENLAVNHWEVTRVLLRVSWNAPQYLNEVVQRLHQDIADASHDELPNRRFLYGELLRQLNRFAEAKKVFSGLLKDAEPYSHLDLLARYELSLIARKDSAREHDLGQVFEKFKDDPKFIHASRVPSASKNFLRYSSLVFDKNLHSLNSSVNKILLWSDDGNTLFARNVDSIISIDAQTGNFRESAAIPTTVQRGQTMSTFELLFSAPDSLYIWRAGDNISLIKLDSSSLAVLSDTSFETYPAAVLPSIDRKSIFYKDGNEIAIRNLESGAIEKSQKISGLYDPSWRLIATDPFGTRIALYRGYNDSRYHYDNQAEIVVWDYSVNKIVARFPITDMRRDVAPFGNIFFGKNDLLYFASDIEDQLQNNRMLKRCKITAFNIHSNSTVLTRTIDGDQTGLSVDPDSDEVAMSCGTTIVMWSDFLLTELGALKIKGNGFFKAIALNSASRRLAVRLNESIIIYDVKK